MTNYRRAKYVGGYYFFTVVTYNRRPFLTSDSARDCLRKAIERTKHKRYFDIIAFCLLPEHLHCIWKLPDDDDNYSLRWSSIKTVFTRLYLHAGDIEYQQCPSRKNKRQRGIWQIRFWEHLIRDDKDLQRHVDYIHYNPVKHGHVEQVESWPWSSYHRYLKEGFYKHQSWSDIRSECHKMDIYE
jgi:putative transposase